VERSQDVLEVATLAGELLLKNGAEITRIESTMGHIFEAYGYTDYHVYAVANGIFATVNELKWDHCSSLRNTSQEGINLRRVEAINHISRQISRGEYTTRQAREALLECQKLTTERWLITVASGVGAGAFCYLAGGSLPAGLLAVPIGMLLQVFLFFVGRYHLPQLVTVVLGSAMATSLGTVIALLIPSIGFENLVIGAIIPLVPGVSFTIGIRDLFNTHYMSGCIHLMDALLTGVCIALGVGAAVFLFSGLGGVSL
jgi:uncharacterized membrane protein YjjP (DUF1212 family)